MALAEEVDRPAALEGLRRLGGQVRPVTLARDQVLPVDPALAPLLPEGGLRRGSSVSVAAAPGAAGATSLALALVAAASAAGSWVGVVGAPFLGFAAASEAGLALERVVVVDPPSASWATVVAALLDAVDVVCTAPLRSVRPAAARRLAARAREQGAVLVGLRRPGPGPQSVSSPPADLRLAVASSSWEGPCGGGAGRLIARQVEVVVSGRGAAARERRVRLWLPGPDGRVAPVEQAAAPAGRPLDVPRLVAG